MKIIENFEGINIVIQDGLKGLEPMPDIFQDTPSVVEFRKVNLGFSLLRYNNRHGFLSVSVLYGKKLGSLPRAHMVRVILVIGTASLIWSRTHISSHRQRQTARGCGMVLQIK